MTTTWKLCDGGSIPNWMQKGSDESLSGTPEAGNQGTYCIEIRTQDDSNSFDTKQFEIYVNADPVIGTKVQDYTAKFGEKLTIDLMEAYFSDPDTDQTLVYTATRRDGSPLPTWGVYEDFNKQFVLNVPALADYDGDQTIDIRVVATDPYGRSVFQVFYVQLFANESVSTGQVIGGAVSGGVLLVGGPLVALTVVKMLAAKKAAASALAASY